jgi:hypothetical protein
VQIKVLLVGRMPIPPKPKWMRWRTYKRAEQQFDRYEEALDIGSLAAVMKLLGLK